MAEVYGGGIWRRCMAEGVRRCRVGGGGVVGGVNVGAAMAAVWVTAEEVREAGEEGEEGEKG